MDSGPEIAQEQGNEVNGPPAEDVKATGQTNSAPEAPRSEYRKGVAPIKAEYLVHMNGNDSQVQIFDDDAAEGSTLLQSGSKAAHVGKDEHKGKREKKKRGQNKDRNYGYWGDSIQLCRSRANGDEFSPAECGFGEKCKHGHDLRKYLREGKRDDLNTWGGKCPVWDVRGICPAGWKCRFSGSHSKEVGRDNGTTELVLIKDEEKMAKAGISADEDGEIDVYNIIPLQAKIDLHRHRVETPKSNTYTDWVERWTKTMSKRNNSYGRYENIDSQDEDDSVEASKAPNGSSSTKDDTLDNRASYTSPPLLPSEKRRLYYGHDTPILAPLTTQGNLPFRRLCVSLSAQITWSEMAMGLSLIQGEKSEWALMKAHASEISPPTLKDPSNAAEVVKGYEWDRDLKFGAQIAANKPWLAYKTTEILSANCPKLRAIDLNCGCPIDLVYRSGAGSALLDSPGKLEKIIRGMNAVSNEIPITAKIRMGTKDNQPTADKVVDRLVLGSRDSREAGLGGSGVAAITLHGRSRQQRYTRLADWEYISDIAALVNEISKKQEKAQDTVREVDDRDKPNGGKIFFVGNGDVYSHIDYYDHLEKDKVDAVMVARGALIKPWIFEEIATQQYLDKSASERLTYIEQFVRNGLECWGSDEMGVGTTRKFLLEWLCFSCRYVPIGLLEQLPPRINERPPKYRGRNELETLLSSTDYRDWIKIRYVLCSRS